MKRQALFFFIVLFVGLPVTGQVLIEGLVLDASGGRPLIRAHIQVEGTAQGTVSQQDGTFRVSVPQLPVRLTASHLNYQTQTLSVTEDSKHLVFTLSQSSSELSPTEITAQRPRNLIPDQPLYVADYTFYGDSLLMLTYPENRHRKARLVLMDNMGNELKSRPVRRPNKLVKGPMKNVFLFANDSVYQVFICQDHMHFLYPERQGEFLEQLQSIAGKINNYYYVKYHTHKGQVLNYYRYDNKLGESHPFATIQSQMGLDLLRYDFQWTISQEEFTEADLRFELMAFYRPVFAPMVTLNDSVLIMNYQEDSIQVYSPEGCYLSSTHLSFHHSDQWLEELIIDRQKGSVYALFSHRGLKRLEKVNLATGETRPVASIDGFRFAENIQVHNNTMYFLYKDFASQRYKKIYRMKVE